MARFKMSKRRAKSRIRSIQFSSVRVNIPNNEPPTPQTEMIFGGTPKRQQLVPASFCFLEAA
jgi:hypothetical protein